MESLVADFPDVPLYEATLASALNIHNEGLDWRTEGDVIKRNVERAIQLREKVLATNPEQPHQRNWLANHYGQLADLLAKTGHIEDALPLSDAAIIQERRLANSYPESLDRKARLAWRLVEAASYRLATGNLTGARPYLEEAVQLYERGLSSHPEVINYPHDLRSAYLQLAWVSEHMGDTAHAESVLKRGLEIQEDIAEKSPGWDRTIAQTCCALGRLLWDAKPDEAEAAYRSALARIRKQLEAEQRAPVDLGLVAEVCSKLGRIGLERGQDEEAAAYYAEARAIITRVVNENPDNPEVANGAAWLLATNADSKFRDAGICPLPARRRRTFGTPSASRVTGPDSGRAPWTRSIDRAS
jgi:tetratricopeptide (TPR) repeat protein